MSTVGLHEIQTQQRVIALLRNALGYTYLGHWKDREGHSHIEEQGLNGRIRPVEPGSVL